MRWPFAKCWRSWRGGPARILLIRHAEKERGGAHLSARGYARAEALVNYFCEQPGESELGPPAAIYAAAPKRAGRSVRPFETVAPLAGRLGVPVDLRFNKDQTSELAASLRRDRGLRGRTVLISWTHGSLPALARALGAKAPKRWKYTIFDRTWRIDYLDGGAPQLTSLPQRLLAGDAAE